MLVKPIKATLHSFDSTTAGSLDRKRPNYLDVEVLVDGVERSTDAEVVLQLDDDVLANQGLEEGVKEHLHATKQLPDQGNLKTSRDCYFKTILFRHRC